MKHLFIKWELIQWNASSLTYTEILSSECFFTYIYRNPVVWMLLHLHIQKSCRLNASSLTYTEILSSENYSKKNVDELNNTLDNKNGKNPYINFVIGDLNAKILFGWGDATAYPGKDIGLYSLYEIIDFRIRHFALFCRSLPPPPNVIMVWYLPNLTLMLDYKNADVMSIRRLLSSVSWKRKILHRILIIMWSSLLTVLEMPFQTFTTTKVLNSPEWLVW